eukprot:m.504293 g.504293  ORF g.504293 m.504293 type:complete len:627 (+) comp21858_c0_seq3:312-2192(+)
MKSKRKSEIDRGDQRSQDSRRKHSSLALAAGILFIAVVLVVFLPRQESSGEDAINKESKSKIGIASLTEISLPSTMKYERVVRDEQKRMDILEAKRSEIEHEIELESTQRYGYNAWLSDKIPLDRRAYDTRDPQCLKRKYIELRYLPRASVIISARNDAMTVLFRTITQVLHRTPAEILHEIIIVDRASSFAEWRRADLREGIQEVVTASPLPDAKVQLLRMESAVGTEVVNDAVHKHTIVRARMQGAAAATGDVLVFLESRCEVNDGWLEPLLDRIRRQPKTIAVPIHDAIVPDTWEWRTGVPLRGALSHQFSFEWLPRLESDSLKGRAKTDPYPTPVMPSGIFAVNRTWFYSIGGYDTALESAKGHHAVDNIDFSLRAWLCGDGGGSSQGGRVDMVPCSHVARVDSADDYTAHTTTGGAAAILSSDYRDKVRLTEVWISSEEEKADILASLPQDIRDDGNGLQWESADTRAPQPWERDSCASFDWYINTVLPEWRRGRPMGESQAPEADDIDPFADDNDERGDDESMGSPPQNPDIAAASRVASDPFEDQDRDVVDLGVHQSNHEQAYVHDAAQDHGTPDSISDGFADADDKVDDPFAEDDDDDFSSDDDVHDPFAVDDDDSDE